MTKKYRISRNKHSILIISGKQCQSFSACRGVDIDVGAMMSHQDIDSSKPRAGAFAQRA
jgi:hypothetical protein